MVVTQAEPQAGVNAPQTRAAIFLVLSVAQSTADAARVRRTCGTLDALVRAVDARDTQGNLTCVVGFGPAIWDQLFGAPRPTELHPFRELRSGPRWAPATPGDLFFHIRAERMDLCFELASQLMRKLEGSATTVDETHGFRYFDDRDLTGFVDGTENPQGAEKFAATVVGDEDPAFAGGSYIMIQKYLHDLDAWRRLPTETQEGIIGRTKVDDIELDEATKPAFAHNALTTLVEAGSEVKILRHNMPFGNAAEGGSGTYFIGYARSPHPLETMLEHMVIGSPPGNYDRLLDYTHAVTGTNLFAPSVQFLERLADDSAASVPGTTADVQSASSSSSGTLRIGSLKGVPQHE
jgi:putative iron-dependent peroxidase